MDLDLNTSLSLLCNEGRLSARTFHALSSVGMKQVRDLFQYADHMNDLKRIWNMGDISFDEVQALMRKVSDDFILTAQELQRELEEATIRKVDPLLCETYNSVFGEGDKVSAYFRSLYPNVVELHKAILGRQEFLLPVNRDFSLAENVALRRLLQSYLRISLDLLVKVDDLNERVLTLYQTRYEQLQDRLSLTDAEKASFFLNKGKRLYLTIRYEQLKAKLPHLTRNLLNKQGIQLNDLIALFGAEKEAYKQLFPYHVGERSIQLIMEQNGALNAEFNRCWGLDDKALSLLSTQENLPDWTFITDHHQKYGYYPCFYIAYKHLLASKNLNEQIYSLYFGLVDGKRHLALEVSEALGISITGVRYNLAHPVKLPVLEIINSRELTHYAGLFALPYVTSDTPEWIRIQKRELPGMGLSQFGALMQLFGINDGVDRAWANRRGRIGMFVYQFEPIELPAMSVVINRKLLPSFDLEACYAQLTQWVSASYSETTTLHLSALIDELDIHEYKLAHELLNLMANRVFGLDTTEDGKIIIKQNYVAVDQEMVGLLREAGHPLACDELFQKFKEKYPAHRYTKPIQLKHYILRNPLIKPIGRSGRYSLDEWDHIYCGNVPDRVEQLLQAYSEPVHITALLEQIHQHHPKVNRRSLRSVLVADKAKRFVHYEKGYFGLRSKAYDEDIKEFKIIKMPMDFDETLAKFRQFVEEHGHFPLQYGEPSEKQLCKWYFRAVAHGMKINEDQQKRFEETLQEFADRHIPTNITELSFKQNCERYLAFAKENKTIHSNNHNNQLYIWWMNTKKKIHKWKGQRPYYWNELLKQLTELGVDFSVEIIHRKNG